MSTTPPTDPRFLRLLKTPKKKSPVKKEESLFDQTPQNKTENKIDEPLLLLAESDPRICKWARSKSPDPEFLPALTLFNLINLEISPEAPTAKRLTLTVLKGTSFPDKRETCNEVAKNIRMAQHSGRIELIHSPYIDQIDPSRNDPWAIKAVPEGYPEENFLGYIPKAQGVNQSFCQAIEKNMFCGAYIFGAKSNNFQGNENQILTIICGWKNQST